MTTKDSIVIVGKGSAYQEDLKNQGYVLIDVTSLSQVEWHLKFSPFYPHGNIPIPGLEDRVSASVEGVFEGLKVFERQGVDYTKFDITSMKLIRRKPNYSSGRVLGYQYGDTLLESVEARKKIYVHTYNYVLTKFLQVELNKLKEMIESGQCIAFLDFYTNEDINNLEWRMSHSILIKKRLIEMMQGTKSLEDSGGSVEK